MQIRRPSKKAHFPCHLKLDAGRENEMWSMGNQSWRIYGWNLSSNIFFPLSRIEKLCEVEQNNFSNNSMKLCPENSLSFDKSFTSGFASKSLSEFERTSRGKRGALKAIKIPRRCRKHRKSNERKKNFYFLDSINIEKHFSLLFCHKNWKRFSRSCHISFGNISKTTINVNRLQLHCFPLSPDLPDTNDCWFFSRAYEKRCRLHTLPN